MPLPEDKSGSRHGCMASSWAFICDNNDVSKTQKTNFNQKCQRFPQGCTFCAASGGDGFALTSSFLLSVPSDLGLLFP